MSITISNPPKVFTTLMLSNVLVCTSFTTNIISVNKMCEENKVAVLFTELYASVLRYTADADHGHTGDAGLGVPRPVQTVSPKGSLSPNNSMDSSSSSSSPLFTLNITNNLYTFRINIRTFSDLNNYNRALTLRPRDPRPFMVLNVASANSGEEGRESFGGKENRSLTHSEGEEILGIDGYSRAEEEQLRESEGDQDQVRMVEGEKPDFGVDIRAPEFRTKTGKKKVRDATSRDRYRSIEEYARLWHRRLGHVSMPAVRQVLQQQNYRQVPSSFRVGICEVCALAKLKEKSYDQCRTQGTRPGEIICADLIGPITPRTYPRNFRFILTTIDSFSRYARVFPLKRKSDTCHYLKVAFDEVRGQFPVPGQIRVLRTDQGKEFMGTGVKQLLFDYGVTHEVSEKFVSQHNGLIERFNRTLQERARALFADSGFPRSVWNVVVAAAEFLYNRTPHIAIKNATPYSMWFGSIPDLRHVVLFGARAYALQLDRRKGNKFHPVAERRYVCGYTPTGYLLYDPGTKIVEPACSVQVHEEYNYRTDIVPGQAAESEEQFAFPESQGVVPLWDGGEARRAPKRDYDPTTVSQREQDNSSLGTGESGSEIDIIEINSFQDFPAAMAGTPVVKKERGKKISKPRTGLRRGRRKVKIRDVPEGKSDVATSSGSEYGVTSDEGDEPVVCRRESETQRDEIDIEVAPLAVCALRIPDPSNTHDDFTNPHPEAPKSYRAMLARPDRSGWLQAVTDEVRAMQELQVWQPCARKDLPQGEQLLPWNWVFTLKQDRTPKARLVIVGSRDKQNYTPSETYSPVPSPSMVRWFLSVALNHRLRLEQLDVRTAFLHSDLPYTKYTLVPDGLQLDRTKYVLRLQKAAYGLAISPLLWYRTLASAIERFGCSRNFREPCIFHKRQDGHLLLVIVYVDDILLASSSPELSEECTHHLEAVFRVKRIGKPAAYVGFQLDYFPERGLLLLHQTAYANEIIRAFLPENERHARKVPLNQFGNFPQVSEGLLPLPQSVPYRSVVGSLYYLANVSRPDLVFAVNYLSRYQSSPTRLHWKLVVLLLRYLYTTRDLGMTYGVSEEGLQAYVDADHGSDVVSRSVSVAHPMEQQRQDEELSNKFKSTTGCLVTINQNPIAWICRKQSLLSCSTTEAEFIAVAESAPTIVFLRELTLEIFPGEALPVTVFEDNLSTSLLLASVYHHGKLKHLALKYLKVKELVRTKVLQIEKVTSRDQLADLFTKPLPYDLFVGLRNRILRLTGNKENICGIE